MPRPAPSGLLTFRDVDTLLDRDEHREPLHLQPAPPPRQPPVGESFRCGAWTCVDCGGEGICECCNNCGKAPDRCECPEYDEPDSIQTLGLGGLVVPL